MSNFRKYRTGQEWTELEMHQLCLYVKEGRSIKEISSLLYRTSGSILSRMRHPSFVKAVGLTPDVVDVVDVVEEADKVEVAEIVAELEAGVVSEVVVEENHSVMAECGENSVVADILNTPEPHHVYNPPQLEVGDKKENRVGELQPRCIDFDEEHESLLLRTMIEIEQEKKKICVFDTETTGLMPHAPLTNSEAWRGTRLVQFAYELYTKEGVLIEKKSVIIQPDGFVIPAESVQFHTITTERAMAEGISIESFFGVLERLLKNDIILVAHNASFDDNIIQSELHRYKKKGLLEHWKSLEKECTMMMGKRYVGKVQKLPLLYEACGFELDKTKSLHQADVDTELCARIYFRLRSLYISNTRYNLVSTYQDKEILKYLGAKWDGGQRVWYIYDSEPFSGYVKKWFV